MNPNSEVTSSLYKYRWDFGGKSLRQFLMFHQLKSDLAATTDKIRFHSGVLASREHYIKLFVSLSGNVYIKIAIGNDKCSAERNFPIFAGDFEIWMGKTKTTSLLTKYHDFKELNAYQISKFVYQQFCSLEDAEVGSGENVFWFRVKKSSVFKAFGKHYLYPDTLKKQNDIMILDFQITIFHPNCTPLSAQNENWQEKLSPTPDVAQMTKKSDSKLKRHLSTEKWFLSTEFSDFTIRCGDQTFPVHKIILANMSPVFAVMFQEPLKEASDASLTITDFDSATVEQFIKFLYTGETNLEEFAAGLLLISEKYNVEGLRVLTENILFEKFLGRRLA